MYPISEYERFSITDVPKFERRLLKWCREEYVPEKSMIIFDKNSLKVQGELQTEEKEGKTFYKVVLPRITIEYIIISGNMCIMTKVHENHNLSVIYNISKKWENAELWYAY